MRKEDKDKTILIRAGCDAGPGPTQQSGEAGGSRRADRALTARAAPTT
jgi:hypothetical protein